MKIRIAVFTGTRAEYGLLQWLMREIKDSSKLKLQVIVSGSHLSPEFGETWKKIEEDGFQIDAKVEMLLSSNTAIGVVKSIGLGTIGFADALDRLMPNLLIILGDRFEALSIAQAALIMNIPIVHIHGGEITEGAYDDSIRHAITKMSSLHFTATESYRNRVIQMGENPESVFNVGAVGLDYINHNILIDSKKLGKSLNFDLTTKYFIITYHPVTNGSEDPVETIKEIFRALDFYNDYKILITYPNADNGGRSIINLIDAYAKQNSERVLAIKSLGSIRYLSALSRASAIIGNSSSGLIEAPSFYVPTINIGIRQRGRMSANSVLNCEANMESINSAIAKVISNENFLNKKIVKNPYGQGNASKKIVEVLETFNLPKFKRFYDIESMQ